jgi:hypothetical protein
MSYSSFIPSTLDDLFQQLNTFLTGAPGWTCNKGSGYFSARKNSGASYDICFAARWDTSSNTNVGIYQWYGAAYSIASEPWLQTNDSGNGANSATNANLALSRNVNIGNSPLQAWFFEDNHYIHVVVETSSGIYAHFGAGQLDKFNDWTGGEYVYGQRFNTTPSAAQLSRSSTFLLDGHFENGSATDILTNAQNYAATIHVESMGEQGGSEKWMVCMGNQASASLGSDRATNARRHMLGGFRAGWFPANFGRFRATVGRAVVPMYPIVPFYWNRTTNNITGPLGQMKDVRGLNIYNFADEEEILVGSDTWVVFPTYRRTPTTSTTTAYTGHQGIAYKKVTT